MKEVRVYEEMSTCMVKASRRREGLGVERKTELDTEFIEKGQLGNSLPETDWLLKGITSTEEIEKSKDMSRQFSDA